MADQPVLYQTPLGSPGAIGALIALLQPHLPYSLPILGYLFHSNQPTPNDLSEPNIIVWTSAPDLDFPPHDIFSVLLFTSADNQFRFFCSADSSNGARATANEEAHVVGVLKFAMQHIISGDESRFRTIRPPVPTQGQSTVGADPVTILIGSVHEKWADCLRPHAARMNPCVKFLCPPQRTNPAVPPDHEYTLTELQEEDLELVQVASGISRSRSYLLGRCATSVCVRTRQCEGENSLGRPIAWALVHADGSIGALHVETEYRRQGLAHFVMHELVRRLSGQGLSDGDKVASTGGGALGWNWTDVIQANEKGTGFMRSLDGWKEEWLCYWVFLTASQFD